MSDFRRYGNLAFLVVVIICASAAVGSAQRTELKPGRNLFTPQQDVELGLQAAQEAEKQLPMLNDPGVDGYLDRLGKKLAAYAPGEKYPYQFKCVNDPGINAFALPGGFLYINRGTIEAADNEAELAGVIGHEIGHVALRHGTNQATKQYLAQFPLLILGGVLGSNSFRSALLQLGAGFTLNSVLLKYSRDDERQADLMGTQILYDAGYDPRHVATFFEKLESRGGTDFFSSHPNPENRIQNINNEIAKLGAPKLRAVSNSNKFVRIRQQVRSLPAAPRTGADQGPRPGPGRISPPARPSSRFQSLEAGNMRLNHPDNWVAYREDEGFILAPDRGLVDTGTMESLAYGMMMAVHVPRSGRRMSAGLEEATNQLIQALQKSNGAMRLAKDSGQIRVGGRTARSIYFTNDSPLGGREVDWLVAVLRPEGLVYFVFVAPEQDFNGYQGTFGRILETVRFQGQ